MRAVCYAAAASLACCLLSNAHIGRVSRRPQSLVSSHYGERSLEGSSVVAALANCCRLRDNRPEALRLYVQLFEVRPRRRRPLSVSVPM